MKKRRKSSVKSSHGIADKNRQARENLAIINPRLRHSVDLSAVILDNDELQMLNTLESGRMKELVDLILKIHRRDKRDEDVINVIFSGDARMGMVCVNLMEKVLGLNLKSLPYNPLYKGKHYEAKGLFIIASDLPVADLNQGFRPSLPYTSTIESSALKPSASWTLET